MDGNRLTNRLKTMVEGKRVLVLGYGKEGRSTHRVLAGIGGFSRLDIADRDPSAALDAPFGLAITGEGYLDALGDCDIVFKTPGIALPDWTSNLDCQMTSQADVFLSEFSKRTIGITGTKGKSTVATLLHHTLGCAGRETILAGNIGTPMFDIADSIAPDTTMVIELSCHQLEYCEHSPSSAVLLNLYEDHLDHYGTFARYVQAKSNIFRFQSKQDVLYTHLEDIPISISANSSVRDVNAEDLPFLSFEDVSTSLRGQHNLLNAAFVHAICADIGIGDEEFVSALRTYQPLPHRLEFIGTLNGVDYYDDSISTTAESSICAAKSVPNAKTLILGGMDRGIDYTPLVSFLLGSNLDLIIGMYESGKRIGDMFLARCSHQESARFLYADDLRKAVKLAQEYTLPGTACILSPAAASYGNFKNFEERGDAFKQLLIPTPNKLEKT